MTFFRSWNLRYRRVPIPLSAAAVLAIAAVTACGSSSGTSAQDGAKLTNLNLAFTTATAFGDAPVWVAQDEGLFRKYGLNVTTEVLASSSIAIPALTNGDVDIAAAATIPLLSAVSIDVPVQAFEGSYYGLPGSGLVINSKLAKQLGLVSGQLSQAQIFADLKKIKGLTIAVESPSATAGEELSGLLRAAGLPANWIKMVAMEAGPTQIAALQHGLVDGFFDNVPNTLVAEKDKIGTIAFTLQGIPGLQGAQYTCMIASTTYIKANRSALQAFTKAIAAANKLLADKAPATIADVDKHLSSAPTALLNPYLSLDVNVSGVITRASMAKMAAVINEWKMTSKSITAADIDKSLASGLTG